MGSRTSGIRPKRVYNNGSILCDNGHNQFRPDKSTWICKPCRTSSRRSLIPLAQEWRDAKRRNGEKYALGDRTPVCPSCRRQMRRIPRRAHLRRRWWLFKIPWR